MAGHGDERDSVQLFGPVNGFQDLTRSAAIGKRHENVVLADQPQVAVSGLAGVQKTGRRAG